MRRAVVTFPVLDEAILIMGMPTKPFLLATMAAFLIPAMSKFHLLSLIPVLVYPLALKALRRHGREDPRRFEIFLIHALVERRFYYAISYVTSFKRLRIKRRSLLP